MNVEHIEYLIKMLKESKENCTDKEEILTVLRKLRTSQKYIDPIWKTKHWGKLWANNGKNEDLKLKDITGEKIVDCVLGYLVLENGVRLFLREDVFSIIDWLDGRITHFEKWKRGDFPDCFRPCPPFFYICNVANLETDKCKKCFKKHDFSDYID